MDRDLVRLLRKTILGAALFAALSGWAGTHNLPITAQAWLVADGDGNVIEGSNITEIRSIASITKLTTVMVVLDANQNLDEIISTKHLRRKLSRRELIALAIVKSDNTATKILCEKYVSGLKGCIAAMNEKSRSLGMQNTKYVEPTGLYGENVSTAEDLIKLVLAASKYPIIVEDSKTHKIAVSVKKKTSYLYNTNKLVGEGYDFVVSKTGWIQKSGGCIVMMLTTDKGIRTVILLGSKDTRTRIHEAKLIALAY